MTSAHALAEQVAAAGFRRAGWKAEAWVDIREMADQFGAVVLSEPLDHAGDIQLVGSTALIRVNRDEPEERRRFTLAHELTHWLHAVDPVGVEAVTVTRAAGRSEEYLADKTAAALLLPQEWLRKNYAGTPHTLQTLGQVARACQVSLSAALVRMRDVARWQKSLFHWERQRGEWALVGEAGLFPSQRGMIRTTECTSSDLNRLVDGSWDTLDAPLRLRCGELEMCFDAEVSVGPGRVVALFELPNSREASRVVSSNGYYRVGRGTTRVATRAATGDLKGMPATGRARYGSSRTSSAWSKW